MIKCQTTLFVSYVLPCSEIDLPATDGSFAENLVLDSNTDSDKLTKMPPSATLGIKDDKAESNIS